MRIKIISIGKKIRSWEKESIEYYLKQLPKNFSIDLINIGGLQHPKISKKEIIEKESKLLMEKISKEDYVVAWDSCGEKINSETLASFLSENFEINNSICFLVGGSFGLSADIKKISNKVFSASMLTFPHRLFRVILVEQIYRAHTIINKMPYHK
tara:strand:+ start:3633 stop:4097 length:465 start_codon:yes stop_codon:yes gene_type:complete